MKSACSVDTVEHVQVTLQLLGGSFNNNLHISEQTQSRKLHLCGTLTFTLKHTHQHCAHSQISCDSHCETILPPTGRGWNCSVIHTDRTLRLQLYMYSLYLFFLI